MNLVSLMGPELLMIGVGCLLFLLGVSSRASARRLAPWAALLTLVAVFVWQWVDIRTGAGNGGDPWRTVQIGAFAEYVRLIVAGVGVLLVLLAWPTNADATGSPSIDFGHDAGEFFALLLLSLSGVFLVATANDIILLFLGIELASIPTYIMVSISRPLPVAQEAGVKYFFLGAMAAAVMLFGFSYLYGTTGVTKLDDISRAMSSGAAGWSTWQVLAVVMLLGGFAFKIAAVPLHAYAGDVYQGAATPVTAFLAFVPKTSGFVAIFKTLAAVGGGHWAAPDIVINLVAVVAGFTMSVGNVLGLLQSNVKRVLAYSSIAHSGYMLVGVAALVAAPRLLNHGASDATVAGIQDSALAGVLFYLVAYGIMNVGAFGVLMMLPSRATWYGPTPSGATGPQTPPATTAETFDDLAGTARRHPVIGLAMAVCCFSLIGLPLTVGFFGKVYLIKPALDARLYTLVVVTVINAAVSAAYYLRIVATMYLRPAAEAETAPTSRPARAFGLSLPTTAAVLGSVALTLLFGVFLPATNDLTERSHAAAQLPARAGNIIAPTTAPAVAAAAGGPQASAR